MTPTQGVIAVLGILLAVSAAGNAWLFHDRTQLLTRDGAVTQLAADTRAAAEACSTSVANQAADTTARQKRIEGRLIGETSRILELQHESLEAQRARPSDPKDLCGSLVLWWGDRIRQERQGAKR